jgi:hypothetical protein
MGALLLQLALSRRRSVTAACLTVQTLEQFQISHLANMSIADLPVGNTSIVRLAPQQLTVSMPEPCGYPPRPSDPPSLPFRNY